MKRIETLGKRSDSRSEKRARKTGDHSCHMAADERLPRELWVNVILPFAYASVEPDVLDAESVAEAAVIVRCAVALSSQTCTWFPRLRPSAPAALLPLVIRRVAYELAAHSQYKSLQGKFYALASGAFLKGVTGTLVSQQLRAAFTGVLPRVTLASIDDGVFSIGYPPKTSFNWKIRWSELASPLILVRRGLDWAKNQALNKDFEEGIKERPDWCVIVIGE